MADKVTSVLARESDGNIQITFTIPSSLTKEAMEETLKEMAKEVEIPGFRKGMAPLAKAAEKIPQSRLIDHSLSHILPKALSDAVTENKLRIAIYPKFELISAEEGKDWQVRCITCELPEVTLGDYKKVIEGELRSSSIIVPGKESAGEPKSAEDARAKKEQTVINALLKNVKVTIPKILIEEEADSRLSNLLGRLEKLGLALENYLASVGKKPEDIRADYANQARDAISLDIILSKIAEAEGIKIDQKEVDAALGMSQVKDAGKSENPEETENRKRLIESILRRRAALDFLINLNP